ncbi:MAG: DUF4333 domain-containing protein [Cyanothece sp. SIO2G6]|nr:DUF4333 domain-containing protein [Cyanothece sp. SIO2G6]
MEQKLLHDRSLNYFWRAIALSTVIWTGIIGCSPRLRTEAIADQIYAELRQQDDIDVENIICPHQLKPEVGQVFRCAGVLEQDAIFVITVEQINELGEVIWEVPHSQGVINLAKLERYLVQSIGRSLGELPTVDCGGDYRINRQGERFDCTVDSNVIIDQRRLETIQVKLDSLGNINWHQVRNLVSTEELEELEALEAEETVTDSTTS